MERRRKLTRADLPERPPPYDPVKHEARMREQEDDLMTIAELEALEVKRAKEEDRQGGA